MHDLEQILERYLAIRWRDKEPLSIARLEKLRDGWESDNYVFALESGVASASADWVWRIYSGVGSRAKAAREFAAMERLSAAGYPVPRVILLETDQSPVDRPFVIMEYVPGDIMWSLLDSASAEEQGRLLDQFCRLFVRLHDLDWRLFDDGLPGGDPFFFIDRWLEVARTTLGEFPEVGAAPMLDWVEARRASLGCPRPSPVHQDFHPGNVLVTADGSAVVIDWTGFDVTDPRFDLAWTLVLAHAYSPPGLRDAVLQGYQHHAGKPVEEIQTFEAIACARRLLDLTVSLTQGAQRMGMSAQATEVMRADMAPHRRVYRRLVELTGLQIETFDDLFGKAGDP